MSTDVVVIIILSVMGLIAHGSRHQPWLQWILRVIFGFAFLAEVTAVMFPSPDSTTPWQQAVYAVMAAITGGMLFLPVRRAISAVLTVINQFVTGPVLLALIPKKSAEGSSLKQSFLRDRIFVPESIPHLNGLWIYVTVVGLLLASVKQESFSAPSIPIPFPVAFDSLFSYNFLGLIVLSVCGCGIFVTRKPAEVFFQRLAIVKPTGKQVGIGLALILFTFFYDWLWSTYTHGLPGSIAGKLTMYNSGTFTSGASPGPAALVALATGICAGVGEETLIRGALMPVFGAIPAGLLHGILHAQFAKAPILILQVAGWSTIMCIVRRYTNTTTTIITHVGYNFITTFLFAFNP